MIVAKLCFQYLRTAKLCFQFGKRGRKPAANVSGSVSAFRENIHSAAKLCFQLRPNYPSSHSAARGGTKSARSFAQSSRMTARVGRRSDAMLSTGSCFLTTATGASETRRYHHRDSRYSSTTTVEGPPQTSVLGIERLKEQPVHDGVEHCPGHKDRHSREQELQKHTQPPILSPFTTM